MKNILTLALLVSFCLAKGQSNDLKKYEVKYNIVNTIIMGSVEVGVERFIDTDQSIGFEAFINDSFSYYKLDKKNNKTFATNSLALSYCFYFSDSPMASGWMLGPLVKYRFGNFTETVDVNGISADLKTNMNSFILGLNVGKKWNFRDKFTVAPYATIGRNFSNVVSDRFTGVEFNAGFSLGYRF